MVFEGKKRFPRISETLWEFQIVTNSETEKSFRNWKSLFKHFRVSRIFFSFRICYYLKLSEGFRNARKPFFYPRKPFLGFRMFGNLFWSVFENTFFLECTKNKTWMTRVLTGESWQSFTSILFQFLFIPVNCTQGVWMSVRVKKPSYHHLQDNQQPGFVSRVIYGALSDSTFKHIYIRLTSSLVAYPEGG
jgi:hypothetical protein